MAGSAPGCAVARSLRHARARCRGGEGMRIAPPEAVGYAPMCDDLSHGRRVERRLARWTACFLLLFLALDAGGIACRMSSAPRSFAWPRARRPHLKKPLRTMPDA